MKNKIIQTRILTDDQLMETLQHGNTDYPFCYYDEHMAQFDFHCIQWHWHVEFEFVYVQSDYIYVNIGSTQIKLCKGQAIFINSKVLHQFTSPEDASIPNFLCHPIFIAANDSLIYNKYVAPLLNSDVQYLLFSPTVAWQEQSIRLIKNIIEVQQEPMNELLTCAFIQQLWNIIYNNAKELIKSDNHSSTCHKIFQLQIIMSYLHTNYMNDISLDDISTYFHISKTALLSLFKEHLQISPINYLIQYRLTKAAWLLLNTEKRLSPIATETGFHNVDYFCKIFKKKYHMTPTEYRKKRSNEI